MESGGLNVEDALSFRYDALCFGSSVKDLKKKCPKSKFLDGLAVRGSDVKKAQKEVNAWIDKTMKAVK